MRPFLVVLAAILLVPFARAQDFPSNDPVIRQMWKVGVEESQVRDLGHHLMDVIGPRLAGSVELEAAQDWLVETYGQWGIPVRKDEIGTWRRWTAGTLDVNMLSPRVADLEAEIKAWSPGTNGPVKGIVVTPPAGMTPETAADWLSSVKGKFVLMSPPEEMCRANQELEANARPHIVEQLNQRRRESTMEFMSRMVPLANSDNPFRAAGVAIAKVDSAGAAGILESRWSGGWGVNKVFRASTEKGVSVDISCEDYGLLYRLVESGEQVEIEVNSTARMGQDVPQFNVVAEMRGSELPDEYVLLGAHLDSWHAGTGATDNGTGTLTMLEAARILKAAYPNPRRTILVGHWANEEMGLIGSGAFREDHPEVIEGLQAAFNQDNGTWFFERIEGQGLLSAGAHIPKWMAALPREFSDEILLEMPGAQNNSGSDHTSFLCAGAPSFRLQSPYDEYRQYTWHTNRDTFDKVVIDDLADNATVAAMMAYMASEDPVRMGREQANLPAVNGRERSWGTCRPPAREFR